MKKVISVLTVIFILAASLPSVTFAAETVLGVVINGEKLSFPDVQPFIDSNGRVQVPARFIGEALGAEVTWNSEELNAVFVKGDKTLSVYVGKQEYEIDGQKKQMDTAAILKEGRIFVPVRYVAEAFGTKVDWDPKTKIINIRKTSMPKRVAVSSDSFGFYVDNDFYELGKDTPAELPEVMQNELVIPVKPLADIFNGTYTLDKTNEQVKLIIDGTTFEFKLYDTGVIIDGVKGKMSYEARLDHGIVRVPASVFIDKLKTYDVKLLNSLTFLIREKGKTDLYDDEGQIISTDRNSLNYFNDFSKEKHPDEVDDIADKIVAKISKEGMSDYDKVAAVNRYIVENTTYDLKYRGVYDAILENTGVCAGYTAAAHILLNKMGVETIYVVGYAGIDGFGDIDQYELCNYSGNAHAWNIVKINGQYYHLDTTFNDGTINGKESDKSIYDYFLLSDNQIEQDHIWRKSFYPQCTTEYDKGLVDNLDKQGYTPITGKIQMEGNISASEDIYILMNSYSNQLSLGRSLIIEKGKNESRFMFIPEKKFDLEVSFQIANLYNYKTSDNYKLEVQRNGNDYSVIIKSEQSENMQTKIVLQEPAKAEQELAFSIITMTPSGTGYSVFGMDSAIVKLTPDMTEAYLSLNPPIPEEEYWYTLRMVRNNDDLYLNEKGELVTENKSINARKYPLDKLVIKIPEGVLLEPVVKVDNRVELADSQLEEIKTALREAHIGEHKKLSGLKSTEDAKLIESESPVEIDENGTIYYSKKLDSGVQVWRSYNDSDDSKRLYYSITLNNIKITEDNYLQIYNKLNDFIKELTGVDPVKTSQVYEDEGECKAIELADIDGLYPKIVKGYAGIQTNYKKDNVTYDLHMGGYASSETATVGITVAILRNSN